MTRAVMGFEDAYPGFMDKGEHATQNDFDVIQDKAERINAVLYDAKQADLKERQEMEQFLVRPINTLSKSEVMAAQKYSEYITNDRAFREKIDNKVSAWYDYTYGK